MSSSLKDRTVHGVGWSFADNILSQGVSFIVGIVLARLLSPQEYGLIGIITIFIAISNSIVDSGFSNALIRKNDASEQDYSTVFITNMVISVLLFWVLFFCAPAIAHFFKQPSLVDLVRVMGSIVVINAFGIIQRTILVKKIDFKTQMKVSLIASVTSGVVGILMAVEGFGVWSLVGQQVSRQLLNVIFLWVFTKWVPKTSFYWNSFKELFGFGWKLLVSSLIDTVWTQFYQVVIGKCYSAQTLGQYTRAQQFSNLFSSNLTSVVQRVSYPALSTIKDDTQRLRSAYQKVIKTTMLVTFCCMLGLAAIAGPMVRVLIGDKWLECIPYLQIVCLQMMLYPLHAINLNMLQVEGRSDIFLKLEIVKKAIAVIPLLLGIFVGIYWMLWGSVVVGFISYYLNARFSGPSIGYSVKSQVSDIIPDFCIALGMALIVYMISFVPASPFIVLPVQIIVGVGIVVATCETLHLNEYLEIKNIVRTALKKK